MFSNCILSVLLAFSGLSRASAAPSLRLAARQTSPKAPLYPEGLNGIIEGGFWSLISDVNPPKNGTVVKRWDQSAMPKSCMEQAVRGFNGDAGVKRRCEPSNMSVFDVKYDDCSAVWTMCRCSDATLSEDDMIWRFRTFLPVGQRVGVRTVMAFNDPAAGFAYAPGPDIVFLDSSIANPVTWKHEGAHNLDWGQTFYQYSNGQTFREALQADSCVADPYAVENYNKGEWREVWANAFVLRRYKVEVKDYDRDVSCMSHQLQVISDQTDELLKATTCDLSRKVPADDTVSRADEGPWLNAGLTKPSLEPLQPERLW